jgi:hypothetical protein
MLKIKSGQSTVTRHMTIPRSPSSQGLKAVFAHHAAGTASLDRGVLTRDNLQENDSVLRSTF